MNIEVSSNHYVDTDVLGTIDSNGLITRYFDKDAVRNSITMWLTSFENDILRNPGKGGYITRLLYRPMTESTKSSLANAIQDGFKQDYTPAAILKNLDISADYVNRIWTINITVYVPSVKDNVDVETNLKNLG